MSSTANANTFLAGDGTYKTPAGGGGGSFALTQVDVDLGASPRYSGTFDITGLSGLTVGKQVVIVQASGPYVGKGDREDEAEMDLVAATGYVVDAATIRTYWTASPKSGPILGSVRFGYAVSS